MALLHCSLATLRVAGEFLSPVEITALLGAEPSRAYLKGKQVNPQTTRQPVYAKVGLWQLSAIGREPADVDGQVREILDRLTADLGVWAQMRAQYEVDLFCGWFMREANEGLSLSPDTLVRLGERGIELALDIYAP